VVSRQRYGMHALQASLQLSQHAFPLICFVCCETFLEILKTVFNHRPDLPLILFCAASLVRSNGILSVLFLLPNLAAWLVHLKVRE
jgi:hypothetical protein